MKTGWFIRSSRMVLHTSRAGLLGVLLFLLVCAFLVCRTWQKTRTHASCAFFAATNCCLVGGRYRFVFAKRWCRDGFLRGCPSSTSTPTTFGCRCLTGLLVFLVTRARHRAGRQKRLHVPFFGNKGAACSTCVCARSRGI